MRHRIIAVGAIGLLFPVVVLAQADTLAEKQRLVFFGLQMEALEYRYSDSDEELLGWNGDAFIGTDEFKLRWITEGEYGIEENVYEALENQLVLETPISDFFAVNAGVRFDTPEGPDRTYAVLGVAGLAPYWIEIDSSLYLSNEENLSVELDAEYELLLTNRLIVVTSVDAHIGFSEDREIGRGKGLTTTELGIRLSYDLIDRAFAPYIGVVHERKYGDTREFARADGASTTDWFALVGARLLF